MPPFCMKTCEERYAPRAFDASSGIAPQPPAAIAVHLLGASRKQCESMHKWTALLRNKYIEADMASRRQGSCGVSGTQ